MRLLAALCLISMALAAPTAEVTPWTEVMHLADTDGDGQVSMNEVREYAHTREYVGFQAFMADYFIDLDTNGDSMVSNEELKAGMVRMRMTEDEISNGFVHGFAFMPKQ